MQKTVESGLGLTVDCSKITQSKEGIKVIEGIVQRYLTHYSDKMESNFRRVLEDVSKLDRLAHSLKADYEEDIDYSNSSLLLFDDPEVREHYHLLIKIISGSTFSVKCAIERYLGTLIPEMLLKNWIDSIDDLTQNILDEITLCDDPFWSENIVPAASSSDWSILDVKVSNDIMYVDDFGDYRKVCWEFTELLSRKRDNVPVKTNRYAGKSNELDKLAFYGLLTDEAKEQLDRQMLMDVQNGIEFNIERLSEVASYDGSIPYSERVILANFFANNGKLKSVHVDPIKVTASWNKEQELKRISNLGSSLELEQGGFH